MYKRVSVRVSQGVGVQLGEGCSITPGSSSSTREREERKMEKKERRGGRKGRGWREGVREKGRGRGEEGEREVEREGGREAIKLSSGAPTALLLLCLSRLTRIAHERIPA